MNCRQLAQLLTQSNPNLCVLYTSGHTENTIVRHGAVDEGVYFLAKQYLTGDLAQHLRELWDERPQGRKA